MLLCLFPCRSTATSLQVSYNPTLRTTAVGTAVTILTGAGNRTFTNRFGVSTVTSFTVATIGTGGADNLLYLGNTYPVDASGISWTLASPVQLPGQGPSVLFNQTVVSNQSGVVSESGASKVDPLGSVFSSSIAGFTNVTIGASNLNALSVITGSCQAPITFSNGLRPPTQPSVSNGAARFSYSYFISDGLTYAVQANLTITCTSAFANTKDLLANPYQIVTNVTGTRLYTYLPTSATVLSTVNGLSTTAFPYADQRFYPYSLLGASPGVYSSNTAPFLDADGVGYSLSPSIPINGAVPGVGVQYNSSAVYISTAGSTAVLVDGYSIQQPSVTYQQQYYSIH